jgi:glutamate--cysteine ligase catalytic subunit
MSKPETEEERRNLAALNDLPVEIDQDAFRTLVAGGMDSALAAHIAHLFIRDPLVIFDDAIDLDDERALVSEACT